MSYVRAFFTPFTAQGFPRASVPLAQRSDVCDLIGVQAEQLVYCYCAMTYDSLLQSVDQSQPLLRDRFTNTPMPLTEQEFEKLLWIKLVDAVEQADANTPKSHFFQNVAKLLGSDSDQYWQMFVRKTSCVHGSSWNWWWRPPINTKQSNMFVARKDEVA